MRKVPLQRRVALLTSFAVAVAVAVTGLAGYFTLRLSLYRSLDSELTEVAMALSDPVAGDIRRIGGLTQFTLQAGNFSVAVVRADGQVFFVPGDEVHLEVGSEELAVARLHNGVSARSGVASDGRPYRIVTVPLAALDNYALVLGRPLNVTNDILSSLWIVLLLFGATGVVLAGAAGTAVARSGLRPVRQLTAAVEHVAQTDDLTPITVTASGDVARLADSFNRMLSTLGSSRERQQRLIADAGHELRTPLTSLRTNIELLAADARSHMLGDADRNEILGDVSAQFAEFTSLIKDLVQLARDDQVSAAPEPIDLRDVITAALERARRRAPKGLKFDVELSPLYVMGEADDLERAVTNLLDNAVKWSPPGGTVRIYLEGDRLRVADQGPGITEADLPHVFDRFYRADTARNTPGTGLGLSIVAQTIQRHGGWIQAGRSAQGGAVFTVQLPGTTTLEDLDTLAPTGF
ncbi:MAG: HAMP domain-containing histidine kinase [Microlunatus sp.]|nr:HAMP domain-containing histidine kinase [Microlunatus sp.]MDN5804212.1 HAMP domain-containing histidine kinase [Microlunatus sp.]